MLDFWFIGCGACVRQEAGNELLWKLYKDRGFSLAGIHNNSANPEEVRHYADKMGLTYLQAVDHKDGRAVAAYKVRAFPTFVLLDRDGRRHSRGRQNAGAGSVEFQDRDRAQSGDAAARRDALTVGSRLFFGIPKYDRFLGAQGPRPVVRPGPAGASRNRRSLGMLLT